MVFIAGVFKRTDDKSAVLMAANGWCVKVGVGGTGGGAGTGGGGGGLVSWPPSSLLQGAVMVFKYSEGLIRRSGAAFGNAGGTKGSAGCLLTRFGPRGLSSSGAQLDPRRPPACAQCERGEKVQWYNRCTMVK